MPAGSIAAGRDDMPTVHASAAFGRAVPRAGDYYGHTVNVAACVMGACVAGSRNLSSIDRNQLRAGSFRDFGGRVSRSIIDDDDFMLSILRGVANGRDCAG